VVRIFREAFTPFFRKDSVQTLPTLAESASAYTLLDHFQFGGPI
jgi:hypothetical protein